MRLLDISVHLTVPSIGDRPPLVRIGTDVRVTTFHLVLSGAIACAVLWLVARLDGERAQVEPAPDDQVAPARLARV